MSDTKKVSSALTTDDLLKLAEVPLSQEELVDLSNYRNDVLDFFSTLNIEPGDYRVNKNTLYLIYKAWSGNPVTRKMFGEEVMKILPFNHVDYLLNKNSIKLTHEAYLKFKKTTLVLKSTKYAEYFEGFLKYHAIEPGEYFIELDFLYLIYTRYADAKELPTKFSKVSFEKYCRIHFLSKQLKTGPAFGVKANVENFFEKGELKRLRRNHGKKKKTNKKK